MKLLYAQPSPFVRKVMVVLHEANVVDSVELVDGFGSPVAPNPAVTGVNPIGKVPCLILNDGTALYDSRVVCRYLDRLHQLGLYPTGDTEWATLCLEAHADGMLDAGISCVYELRCREEGERSETWRNGQREKIARGLDILENQWLTHLNGPLDIGQIGVGCALDYLDFRMEMGGWTDWRDGRPGLATWSETFLQRASMQATAPQ